MNELMIDLQPKSKKALYEQIYEYIRDDILGGKISCGEKLPSTRLLAKELQVSRSTVELAFAQLVSEGYLESVACSGYYAADISWLYQSNTTKNIQTEKKKDPCKYTYNFSPDVVDLADFPENIWRKISRNVVAGTAEQFMKAGDNQGDYKLREAICNYLYQARGMKCVPEQVIVGAGNEYLLMLLSQILSEQHVIAMESPTYTNAYHTFENLGWQVKSIAMDEAGISIHELNASDADLAYVMPSHQFPLGTVMQAKRKMELLHWAGEKKGRYIIEDDYDSEFRYVGKPIPALQGFDQNGTVIYIGTFSKSISSAIRVSYMVLPLSLQKKYEETCGFYSCTVAKVQQETLYQFINGGYFARHLNRMRGIYKGKHDFLLNCLRQATWVKRIFGEHAGLHLLVEVDSNYTEEQMIEKAKKIGVRIYALSEYEVDSSNKRTSPILILGYAGMSIDEIRKGLQLLEEKVFVSVGKSGGKNEKENH